MDRALLTDLLTIAQAVAEAPASFVVRRTLERIRGLELGVTEAAAVLRAHDPRWGSSCESSVSPERRIAALDVGRLFDR